MPIRGVGWEMHIVRRSEQTRASDGKRRTVGSYQIYHDGTAQTGAAMRGMVAETRGPGANAPAGNNRRIEAKRYPLATQDGSRYKTWGYSESEGENARVKPGIEVTSTGQRSEILIHPGHGFLASVGCINPCTSLPNAREMIDYAPSRKRMIAVIEDMKSFIARFPATNGKPIPGAFVVIDGEP